MVQFISRVSVRPLGSSGRGARAALPVFIAAVLLSSLAQAQEAPVESAPVAAPEQPSAPPPAAPVEAAPAPAPRPAPPPPPAPDAPPPEHAPRERLARHEGFYLRLGSGPSVVSLNGNGPTGDDASLRGLGSGGFIAIGGAIAPGLVLAGTLQGAGLEEKFKGGPLTDATITVDGETRPASRKATGGFGILGVLIDWYPKPRGGWHTGFATGVGAIALENKADGRDMGGLNWGGSVFGGYDWAITRDWSLGLQLTASGATKTKMRDEDGDRDTGYRLTPLSIGVQASVLYF